MKEKIIFVFLLLIGISMGAAAECGDVNSDGTVDIVDALLIAQYYVDLNPVSFDSIVADVNADNSIDIVDALLIAQLYVGLIDELDCTETPTLTPSPTPVETETVFAVNCGGSAYTGSDGTVYTADAESEVIGGSAYDNGSSVSGTSDPTLYATERYGSCTYSAEVPNGDYLVTLHFAENYHTSAGSRVFNVLMEGTQSISNLDIYAQAGAETAYITENQVSVSDGQINIEFVTVTENALINAIKIQSISYTGEPIVRFTINPSSAKPNEMVTVDASASYDSDGSITNYEVNWGEGNPTNGAVTSHTYENEGTYTITVTVTDNEGKTTALSKEISVKEITVNMDKLRVIMSSDFPPFPVTNSDPDDVQSMVRFLLYTNEFDVEGIIASAGTFNMVANKQNVLAALDKYDQVDENLRKHDSNYPTAAFLRSVTYQGLGNEGSINIQWGCGKQPWSDIIGSGRDSEASEGIIAAADKDDPRPIYIGVWGGPREVAQAIWKVKNTRSQAELDAFIGKIRVYLIACQDATHGWLMDNFPNLLIVESRSTYQGMFGVDNQSWVNTNIINNHGPLCAIYPDEAMAGTGVIEGDTPSFLGLISANPNRLGNDPDDPTQPSWGGQYSRRSGTNHYVDGPGGSTISQWKADFEAEFAERADWCVE
ncbi:MAG: DUF1593 domain-containing protein [Spirochaetales bacterium]|nr:DUF1593 domain-containing protein [Spirochaetales bacterium]